MTELQILDWLSNLDPAMKAADTAVRNKYLATINPGYYWYREGDVVVLRDGFSDPVRYDEAFLRHALSNVEAGRSQYATYDAWLREFTKLHSGLAFFSHRTETRPPLPGPGDPLVE